MPDVRVLEYLDPQACSPFAAWFDGLNAVAAALYQLAADNWSNVKGVRGSVMDGNVNVTITYWRMQLRRDKVSTQFRNVLFLPK